MSKQRKRETVNDCMMEMNQRHHHHQLQSDIVASPKNQSQPVNIPKNQKSTLKG